MNAKTIAKEKRRKKTGFELTMLHLLYTHPEPELPDTGFVFAAFVIAGGREPDSRRVMYTEIMFHEAPVSLSHHG